MLWSCRCVVLCLVFGCVVVCVSALSWCCGGVVCPFKTPVCRFKTCPCVRLKRFRVCQHTQHTRTRNTRQLTKICPHKVITCSRGSPNNHWILQNLSLRISREQHVSDSSEHSFYLIKLLNSSSPEGEIRNRICWLNPKNSQIVRIYFGPHGRPRNINVFQWNHEYFFLRQLEIHCLDDRWSHLGSTKIRTAFNVICGLCRLRHSQFTLKFSAEMFTPNGRLVSALEWFLGIRSLFLTPCKMEYEYSLFLADQHFLRLDSSGMNTWCVRDFQIFQVNYQIISFPNSPSDQLVTQQDSWWYIRQKLMFSWWISPWKRMIYNQCSKPFWRLKNSPHRLSYGAFPSTKKSWPFCRKQQQSKESDNHLSSNPDCSTSSQLPSFTICLVLMKCWKSVLPWQIFTCFPEFHRVVGVHNFWFGRRLQEFFTHFCPSHVKISFCKDKIESSEWQDRVSRQRNGWLYPDSHPSLRTLWSAVIQSPNPSARSRASPMRLLQGAFDI